MTAIVSQELTCDCCFLPLATSPVGDGRHKRSFLWEQLLEALSEEFRASVADRTNHLSNP